MFVMGFSLKYALSENKKLHFEIALAKARLVKQSTDTHQWPGCRHGSANRQQQSSRRGKAYSAFSVARLLPDPSEVILAAASLNELNKPTRKYEG